ncbi:MAG: SUMF1/EgtB/PvdO family nonheme iron enzyme [Dysgonamonadaceae bacterium]|nr:SUMF1/EgtB/PvdO family nonheme iron enzyme [Dysgonamonadaceae bacterium]
MSLRCKWDENRRGSSNRVLRGGSWNNNANNCRVSNRNNNNPYNRNNNYGFRVVSRQHITLDGCQVLDRFLFLSFCKERQTQPQRRGASLYFCN